MASGDGAAEGGKEYIKVPPADRVFDAYSQHVCFLLSVPWTYYLRTGTCNALWLGDVCGEDFVQNDSPPTQPTRAILSSN
jgi:hypothetical protein